LPKCRGCGGEHRVKRRRLYMRAMDALERGIDTIYIA
jgi:hypothetical protein